jgi:serine/threonine-protein kinase
VSYRITEATVAEAIPPMFSPGTVLLGRYRLESELGVGGCSIVLRAQDQVLGQPVAFKIVRSDLAYTRDIEARLLREARAITQLTSDHVVRIFDVGKLETGAPFIAMELMHGTDLAAMLERDGSLAPAIAVDYVLQACDGLAEAHARGIVHRDVKPSNLFVVERPDGSELVKVLDFGIAKSTVADGDMSLTQTVSVLGTPAYMAPEQMRSARSADARSDVWAIGVVLYELVEGRLPYTGSSFADLVIAASMQPVPPLVRAPQLTTIIERCLAKSPDERYASMAELAVDLARFASRPTGLQCAARASRMLGIASPSASAVLAVAPLPSRRRYARPLAIAGAAFAAISIATALIGMRRDRPPPPAVERRLPAAPVAPPAAAEVLPTAPPTPPAPPPPAATPPAIAPPAAAPPAPSPPAATPPTISPPAAASPPPPAESPRAAVQSGVPPRLPASEPAPSVRTHPGSGTGSAAPGKPRAPRKPAADAAACDPYSRPEGC